MNSNNRNYFVNIDSEKEPLLPPNDDKIDTTTEHVLSEIEIVDTIMKASLDISLRYISREELIKVISNLHNHQQHAFSSNDFIVLKKYEDYAENENEDRKSNHEYKYDYGVFKHKNMDFIFRVDSVDGQVEWEDKIARILLNKYNNNYKDVVQMGILLPMYVHIQNTSQSSQQLQSQYFPLNYSIQIGRAHV